MKRRKHPNNRIWTVLSMLAAVILSLYSIRSTFVSVVALEQSARCGAEEHIHGPACYDGGTAVCGKTVHTHNRNCYLVLLKDNDINVLLSQVDAEQTHNLERLIYQTVDTALQYNTDLITQTAPAGRPSTPSTQLPVNTVESLLHYTQAPESESISLQTSDVAVLNQTITEQEIEPAIVLNEDLYTTGLTSSIPADTLPLASTSGSGVSTLALGDSSGNGGISTLALGDSTPTRFSNNYMYFYVQLDGTWTYLTTIQRTNRDYDYSNFTYIPYITTSTLLNSLNTQLQTDTGINPGFTADNLALEFSTNSTVNASNWSGEYTGTSSNGTKTTFGTSNRNTPARHVRMYHKVNGVVTNPVAYYTVTLTYPNSSENHYVPAGGSYTLPSGYTWTADGNTYAGGTAVPINNRTTFTATINPGDVTNKFHFYVQLDGEWTLLTTMDRTGITHSGSTSTPYAPYITTAAMLSGVNDQLRQTTIDSDASFTAGNLTGRYADSSDSASWNWSTTSGNNTLFGGYADWNDADAAKHIRLYQNTPPRCPITL